MDLQRIAILDLGTNTFHLLIAELDGPGNINILYKKTIPVKLGEGGIADGRITDAAFERGIYALRKFKASIDEYQVNQLRAAGTAALRMAINGKEFIDTVAGETGIRIEIIDGEEEAELIYEGVRKAVSLNQSNNLIIDIGGGSVEFILCNNDEIFWKKSYPIGAAKLMAMFHHTDPISKENITQIESFLNQKLSELKEVCVNYSDLILIGSAGAFETFAELEISKNKQDISLTGQNAFLFNLDDFFQITEQLLLSTHDERASNNAIEEVRIDMIIVASILTRFVLKMLRIDQMKLSAYSLKEGMMYKLIS